MVRWIGVVAVSLAALSGSVSAQESMAAKTTRAKLKQKITVEFKEVGTKAAFDEIAGEMEKPVKFKIDNGTGVSNNTKFTYTAKEKTVEEILNDISDKLDFGWYVVSNESNNKVDGWVVIRKSSKGKERGYEAGKEPKSSSTAPVPSPAPRSVEIELELRTTFAPALELELRRRAP